MEDVKFLYLKGTDLCPGGTSCLQEVVWSELAVYSAAILSVHPEQEASSGVVGDRCPLAVLGGDAAHEGHLQGGHPLARVTVDAP